MTHGLTPDLVPNARRLAHMFLRHNAPMLWAQMMASGTPFLVPEEIAHLGIPEQARWLAAAEARRVAKARLFHLDVEATRAAIHAGSVFTDRAYALGSSLPPAEYGLLVWAEDVSASAGGVDVIACHWQVRDDGVWTVWWTDAVTFTRAQLAAGTYDQAKVKSLLELHGVLMYDRERLLPYGVGELDGTPPDAAMDARVRALTHTTIATWAMLSTGLTPTTVLPGPTGTVAGLAPIPGADDSVTVATAPTPTDPAQIFPP